MWELVPGEDALSIFQQSLTRVTLQLGVGPCGIPLSTLPCQLVCSLYQPCSGNHTGEIPYVHSPVMPWGRSLAADVWASSS